jgi:hypothetical protein
MSRPIFDQLWKKLPEKLKQEEKGRSELGRKNKREKRRLSRRIEAHKSKRRVHHSHKSK